MDQPGKVASPARASLWFHFTILVRPRNVPTFLVVFVATTPIHAAADNISYVRRKTRSVQHHEGLLPVKIY